MPGTLYLVPTPIGNLSDLSPRAVETLSQADFIAAEDTRVTLKLLNHFTIKKPMVAYYRQHRCRWADDPKAPSGRRDLRPGLRRGYTRRQ